MYKLFDYEPLMKDCNSSDYKVLKGDGIINTWKEWR